MNKNHTWIANALWGVVAIAMAASVIWLFSSQEQKDQKQALGGNSAVYNADAVQTAYQQKQPATQHPTTNQQPADSSSTNATQKNDETNNNAAQPTSSDNNNEKDPESTSSTSTPDAPDGTGVSMIGDSVTVGIAPYLQEQLPNMTIDGKVSRQMSQADDVINNLVANNKLGDHVILELGTNGPFSSDQLRSVLQSLSSAKQVLLVTARVPKPWQDTVNDTMTQVGREFPNVQIVDWYGASAGKDQYFYNDGVHLKPDGSRYYTSLLVAALEK